MFTDRRANSLPTQRVRQPWPAGKPFRILALDGGGIRGIYTAELLQRCEENFSVGQPLARHVAMIAGTSTGGIIALGLGLGIAAAEITQFYRNDGRRIFPPLPDRKLPRLWRFASWLRGPVLRHEELEKSMKCRFGDHRLGESMTRLVIPAFMMPKTEIAVFKTDHHEDFRNDHLTPMWKVARATSAAPTYLKGLENEESGRIFIDGGVWSNNPVMVALVDSVTAYELSFDQVEILSIGTGNAPFCLHRPAVLGGAIAWRAAINAAMFLTTDNATAQAKLLLGADRCLRIEPSEADSMIELDDYDGAFAALPERAAAHFEVHSERMAQFFANIANPRESHYSAFTEGLP